MAGGLAFSRLKALVSALPPPNIFILNDTFTGRQMSAFHAASRLLTA